MKKQCRYFSKKLDKGYLIVRNYTPSITTVQNKTKRYVYILFIVELFKVANTWNKSQCPTADEYL